MQNTQVRNQMGFQFLRRNFPLNIRKIASITFVFIIRLLPLDAQNITIDKEVRMLALGDSYTIGQSVSESGRWPHQFMEDLWTRGVTGNYPDYIATTGWTTKNLLQGLETYPIGDKSYNLVSILIGVNNQYQGAPIQSYEPELSEIIDIALDIVKQDKSRIFILSIPDYAYTPFGNGNASISKGIDDYNSIKRSVAAEYGIAYIDITPISRQGLNDPSLVANDGLHPSAVQYGKWVKEIIPQLEIDLLSINKNPYKGSKDALNIYPNPIESFAQIDAGKTMSRISIFDSLGKIVFDRAVNSKTVQLDLSGLAPGLYAFYAFDSSSNDFSVKKLIIQGNSQ